MIRGAIFDLDGTLLDSMPAWDNVGEAFLHSVGRKSQKGLKDVLKTFSLRRSALYFKEQYGVSMSMDAIIEGMNAIIEEFYKNDVQLKPGTKELLLALSKRGISLIVATETNETLARTALRRCGVHEYFCDVLSCENNGVGSSAAEYEDISIGSCAVGRKGCGPSPSSSGDITTENSNFSAASVNPIGCIGMGGKHSPYIFRRALALLGTEKAETVVFEDALYALRTAHDDGFPTIAVFDPHEPEQEALRKCADLYVPSLERTDEILEFIAAFSVDMKEVGATLTE